MDLLPKSKSEFTSKQYWEKFFQKRQKAFEWYGEYTDLCGILHKYIKQPDKVLIVGCGNSRLSADLYDVGYRNTVSVDISDTVIAQMKSQHAKERPDLCFVKMDVTKLDYGDGSFSVVLDKGTLDALMPDTSESTMSTVTKMFDEIARVLRVGGRYICVTLAQPHLIEKTLHHFSQLGWMIRACRVPDTRTDDSDFHLPVFVLVLTKFKKMPGMKLITEISNFEDTVERLDGVSELLTAIQGIQQYGMIRQQLGARSHTDEQIAVELFTSASDKPRYTIYVVDQPKHRKNKFAIFIVPEGRETEWTFATSAGRQSLVDSARCQRLLVASLSRDHRYDDGLEGVKAELSSKVMELAPSGVKDDQVPFLSAGEEINTRTIRHRSNSSLGTDIVVEDVQLGEDTYRRLIFTHRPFTIQSEVRLIASSKKKKAEKHPDPDYLTLGCYKHMVAGLAFLHSFQQTMADTVKVSVIGLGGGCLATFLHNNFSNLDIECVEKDPQVIEVAKKWFSFVEAERLKIICADGVDHVRELVKAGERRHVVFVNTDNKEKGAIVCPSETFTEAQLLHNINSLLQPSGAFVLNFVCTDESMKSTIFSELRHNFGYVCSTPLSDSDGQIIYAVPDSRKNLTEESNFDTDNFRADLALAQKLLQESVTSRCKAKSRSLSDVVTLSHVLEDLKII